MRSLFAKILGWFLLTTLAALMATAAVSFLIYNPKSKYNGPLSALIGVGLTDSIHAWETGGRDSLALALDRFRKETEASTVALTDANGVDLMTGQLQPNLIAGARRFARLPVLSRGELGFDRYSADGKYCFFVVFPPVSVLATNFQPMHFVVFALVMLLCYALAHQLTAPLRALRIAVDKFGQGDFSARAPEGLGDEVTSLATAFNRMGDRIQTLLAAERRLLLDISHELRSPLARLSVAVELARSGQPRALDRIQKEADRLNDLISQMLQVTRLEAQTSQTLEPVRLDELVRDIVNDCSIEASVNGCAVLYPPPPDVVVSGNRELLRRAIENVLRNAIRYAPPESKIDVLVDNGGSSARVRIRDQGPGVPEEALSRLCDPFFRVDSDRNRERGGVGLGLSIAKRAVELHKGNLRAKNANPGLQVEIELPA